MCGIWAILSKNLDPYTESLYKECVKKLEARGPERTSFVSTFHMFWGFTRLAINGLSERGDQPIQRVCKMAMCNGEIYNYKELAERVGTSITEGESDCIVLPYLLDSMEPTQAFRAIDGVFACIVNDYPGNRIWVARDPYGVRPLFQGRLEDGSYVWSSEIKAMPTGCVSVEPFPPGTWREFNVGTCELVKEVRYHTIPWVKTPSVDAFSALRYGLVQAVEKRLLSDRPVGALLSGGLDSSLVAAIASKLLKERGQTLHTFSIGMPGSTDLVYARKVAEHIGSEHHEIVCTKQDFLDAILPVIHAIESYDITTVRASVGNWLVAKWIRENTDIKVVLNGDGSDEVGGGYLYFYKSPSDFAFEAEVERLLEEIHMFDVLRSDRSIACHGLEARTPFLDKQFVATWLAIPTHMRRPVQGKQVEKWVLREAFADTGYLPDSVLWRKKEAFSDGVSSTEESWYVTASKHAEESGVTPENPTWIHNPPATPEGAWYRTEFEKMFGVQAVQCIPHMWMPRWMKGVTDPSARVLKDLY